MTKILVAADDLATRRQCVDILFRARYDVVEAHSGPVVIERVTSERPDLVLMEVDMRVMDGLEVLTALREQPEISTTPVILMASEANPRKGQVNAWALGVRHYIIKPSQFSMVELSVKVTLREAEAASDDAEDESDSVTWQGSTTHGKGPSVSGPPSAIGTGIPSLNAIMGGGIALGSMTLIEGTPSVGKSVLCQHITYESLQDGHGVAYFTSGYTASGLGDQMRSLGLDVSAHLGSDKLRILPLREPALDGDCEFSEETEQLMGSLIREMELLPAAYEVIIVDAITNLALSSEDRAVLRFFSSCRRLCNDGRAIVVVTQSHAFEETMLGRLRDLCDAYFSLRVEMMGRKMGTALEVLKANNADLSIANTVSFEVLPELGIQTMAFGRFRV